MTNDEIKKALRCCKNQCCSYCPHWCEKGCQYQTLSNALDLITEQENEIERLKAENDTNMQYIRMMGIQSHIKTSNEQVKQAKIDILNKLKERLYSIFVTKSSPLGDITVEDIAEDIDELIKEVENAEDNN